MVGDCSGPESPVGWQPCCLLVVTRAHDDVCPDGHERGRKVDRHQPADGSNAMISEGLISTNLWMTAML